MENRIYQRQAFVKNMSQPQQPSETKTEPVISPDLQDLIDESEPNAKHDALLFHRSPEESSSNTRMAFQDIQTRSERIEKSARINQSIQTIISEKYHKYFSKRSSNTIPEIKSIGSGILSVAKLSVTKETLPILGEIPEVLHIMPDYKVEFIKPITAGSNQPLISELKSRITWGLELLQIPRMWEITRGGGVNVAVLDSGVDAKHIALKNRIKLFAYLDSSERISITKGFDTETHGTHVCGTIAGSKTDHGISIGVAPESNLIVIGRDLSRFEMSNVFRAIDWAVGHNAHIINMSLGWPLTYFGYIIYSEILEQLIYDYGIIPVVAIGNEGFNTSRFPGNADSSFAVGAIEPKIAGINVWYRSGGSSLVSPKNAKHIITKPDIVAPGVHVHSCVPSKGLLFKKFPFDNYAGTSMAAPHVSGAVALLMAAHPKAPVTDIANVLKETAFHPNGPENRPDNRWGYGMIRPFEAHKALK